MKKSILPLAVFTLSVSIPRLALAHAPIRGFGDFCNGVLHPVLVPSQVITSLAVGLLIGQQSKDITLAARGFMFALLAGLLGAAFGLGFNREVFLMLVAVGAGLLTAINTKQKNYLYWRFAVGAAAVLGLDSAPDGLTGKPLVFSLLGTFLGGSLGLFYVARVWSKPREQWQHIGIRIVASWTAASALLVMALQLLEQKTGAS
jgi:urease accessory protein